MTKQLPATGQDPQLDRRPMLVQERPLEFRVWHLPTQCMYAVAYFTPDYVYLPWDDSKTDSENYKVVDHPFARLDCMLLQFTGVYDAKGQKIFEGDILYWRYYDESENKVYESWHEVIFHQGAFGTMDNDDDLNTFYNVTVGEVVVGNVFENPQMLRRLPAT